MAHLVSQEKQVHILQGPDQGRASMTPNCTHIYSWHVYVIIQKDDGEFLNFEIPNKEKHRCNYCPKCGVKL